MAKTKRSRAPAKTSKRSGRQSSKPQVRSRRNAVPRNEREAHARERALAVVASMRREGLSLRAAAKAEGTGPETVLRYARTALRKDGPGGRYRVAVSDRIARTIAILTPQGEQVVTVRNSRDASRIGEYMNAVRAYARGDPSGLAQFQGKAIRTGGVTYPFVTEPWVLDDLARADALAVENLYRAIK
jgi:hypothetical protein